MKPERKIKSSVKEGKILFERTDVFEVNDEGQARLMVQQIDMEISRFKAQATNINDAIRKLEAEKQELLKAIDTAFPQEP